MFLLFGFGFLSNYLLSTDKLIVVELASYGLQIIIAGFILGLGTRFLDEKYAIWDIYYSWPSKNRGTSGRQKILRQTAWFFRGYYECLQLDQSLGVIGFTWIWSPDSCGKCWYR
ncbi:hypothetical protein BTJ40_14410 [Microbulbifer sp. A4B17]|uniref:hypothetical protein n=1 Tax=Microbulbifer sp. A4B17 TaxID=359370 RepID=UPI000D52E216|nr:hypothetical protein [Microbulbifer sp. A4B17]AWF81921.1 hypothetical protein BTJ40_14410 [Microbulbifer sp. A4B17]